MTLKRKIASCALNIFVAVALAIAAWTAGYLTGYHDRDQAGISYCEPAEPYWYCYK